MAKEFYKIRHIPTGLFVTPSRKYTGWSTLSRTGKIYEGPNMWVRIQNRTEWTSVQVGDRNKLYEELATAFPQNVKETYYSSGKCVRFYTSPEDFEKVVIGVIED